MVLDYASKNSINIQVISTASSNTCKKPKIKTNDDDNDSIKINK